MNDAQAATQGEAIVGAASVHWRRQGSGPPIVFLPGFPLAGEIWDGVIARLRNRFTCWTADLIGLGRSHSAASDDYASPGQAQAVRAMLSTLGVESYALVGNDTGGWIARELALIDPPKVTHLVLTNTEIPSHRPPWIPLYQTLAHLPGSGAMFRQLLKSRAFRRSPMAFGGCFHDLQHLDGAFHHQFVEPLIASASRINDAMHFLRQMKFGRLDEFCHLHRQLEMPTLFIWGAEDPTFPTPLARQMVDEFANPVGFHAIANAKLLVHAEQPQEVATLIDRFLAGALQRAAN